MEFDSAAFFKRIGPKMEGSIREVIIKRFFPSSLEVGTRIASIVLLWPEETVKSVLETALKAFRHRHSHIEPFLLKRYDEVRPRFNLTGNALSVAQGIMANERKMLIASYFVHEYAIETAALFNPSMIPHPDQTNLPSAKTQRVLLSLRATGEGHISSIAFRTGIIQEDNSVVLDPASKFPLSVGESKAAVGEGESKMYFNPVTGHEFVLDVDNYDTTFDPEVPLDRRVVFPAVRSQSNGVEDARFIRFTEEGQTPTYYATFTAYDGTNIMPQMVETKDFLSFSVRRLRGAIKNKGMALFPRKIQGKYWMLSRQDDVNVLIMSSDEVHHWENPKVILQPEEPWEMFKMGNCGSPIETPKGWLVLTHGVGPMRRYCISAAMLDLEDPSKVIGRMKFPLIAPNEAEREGYVPNVVYTCGALLHNGSEVVIPYATSDSVSSFGSVSLNDLYAAMGLSGSVGSNL